MKSIRRRLPDILYCWFLVSLILPNVLLSLTEPMGGWARVANVALPLGVIGILAAISDKVGRTVWLMFPLVFLAAFQIVLLGLYGRSVIAVDMFLNLVTTNSTEVGELLGSLWPSILFVCLLYLPALVTAIYISRRDMRLTPGFTRRCRRFSVTAGCVGLVALAMSYMAPTAYAVSRDLYPVNVGYNICLAVDRTIRTGAYHDTSADFRYGARCEHPDSVREVCVLVVGETSRAADWQLLGYGRPTNPRLSRRQGLYCAPQAVSESNTTHKSVPMLLSPVEARTFGSAIYEVKSLITAFGEAGYETAFFSNQQRNHSFIDFFGLEADTALFVREAPGYRAVPGDFGLLPYVASTLAGNARKQLIVLHTYGSHFNYCDRYGDEDAHFKPDRFPEASAEYRRELVNAYDNTIVATDRFLDSLISMVDSVGCRASLLYASDHGEDIFDDGSRHFLHASPLPSVNQVHVPMLVWLSDSYRSAYPEVDRALRANCSKLISTSRSYCPTALTLGGISTPRVDAGASVASRGYKPREPLYLNDHNEPVALKTLLK